MVDRINNGAFKCALGAALVAAMLLIAGCGDIFGHDEFDKMVLKRTEEQVTADVGKPEAVDKSNPARVIWTYYSKTYDIENQNKRDSKTLLIFTPGDAKGKLQVSEIKYER